MPSPGGRGAGSRGCADITVSTSPCSRDCVQGMFPEGSSHDEAGGPRCNEVRAQSITRYDASPASSSPSVPEMRT